MRSPDKSRVWVDLDTCSNPVMICVGMLVRLRRLRATTRGKVLLMSVPVYSNARSPVTWISRGCLAIVVDTSDSITLQVLCEEGLVYVGRKYVDLGTL